MIRLILDYQMRTLFISAPQYFTPGMLYNAENNSSKKGFHYVLPGKGKIPSRFPGKMSDVSRKHSKSPK